MLAIIQAPHSVLSAKAKDIKKFDKNLQDIIAEMTDTLLNASDPEGVGLAAPQVGKSLNLFIIKEDEKAPIQVFINAQLTIIEPKKKHLEKKVKKEKSVKLEGCLSLKDIWGVVHRAYEVELTYQDEHGVSHTKRFTDFLATIIQHEYDHLQGVLFPKRVLEQKGTLYKSVLNEKNEMEFQELTI
jgi:peptide deformylase